MRRIKKIGIILASICMTAAVCVAIYVGDCYRADETAQAAMVEHPLSGIVVYEVRNGMTVFAPEQPEAGFIFYPGGKVEYTAYAPLLRMLAGEGILCVALEMPLNLAVLDVNAADGVQEQFAGIDDWYIGGHSLGGSMAASHAAENTDIYEGLILLASYSTANLRESGLDVLSIYGSEDGVLNMGKYAEYAVNLPVDTVEYIIDGGNHAQFGSYGLQEGDGEAAITAQEQTTLTSVEIVNFILGMKELPRSNTGQWFVYGHIQRELPQEIDSVRITFEWHHEVSSNETERFGEHSKQTSDVATVEELWDLYTSVSPEESSRPMDFPRYWIEFLSGDEVVSDWRINGDGVISGDRFCIGNHYLGENTVYSAVEERWERDIWAEAQG